tara:strand:- start:2203 stop:2919 length:717 start_codon:yes stop_codon:yes gene_type:complete
LINKKNIFPIIILLEPQLEENIGAVARAMLNFNFKNLRIIKNKWKPKKITFNNAAKADEILKKAKVFNNLEDAIKDLQYVYATSNRKRDLSTEVVNLKKGIKIINNNKTSKVGILFGPERSGLKNEDISLCDKIIEIPLNKNFKSLNLAQSVLLVVYELFNSNHSMVNLIKEKKIRKKELFIFYSVLEHFLEEKNFFQIKKKKKKMMLNIKTIFSKANLIDKEIRILLGVIRSLSKKN